MVAARPAAGIRDHALRSVGECSLAFNMNFDSFRSWKSYPYVVTAVSERPRPRDRTAHRVPSTALRPAWEHGVPGRHDHREGGGRERSRSHDHHIFAMVKRGCDFDVAGAKGWEWMEIKEDGAGNSIIWRGVGLPAGEQYGGDPNAGVTTCHVACSDNDAVCSTQIRLR